MDESTLCRFRVRLAGLEIGVASRSDYCRQFCQDYLSDSQQEADFSVFPEDSQILEKGGKLPGLSDGYTECVCILGEIGDRLPLYDRLLIHGAAISYGGVAYLFTAPSGTGKSTHISLWRKYLGDRVGIVNGDKPFLALDARQVTVYGTPWAGKEGWQRNCAMPLAGICFLHRGAQCRIRSLAPGECLEQMYRQIYFTQNAASAGRALELMDRLVTTVPLYEMECDISEAAVRCSFQAMTGENYDEMRKMQ